MNIAVVTGASSGIGREFVIQIAQKYKNMDEIWILARRKERLTKLSADIAGLNERIYHAMPYIRPIVCDITRSDHLNRFKNMLADTKPSVRVLVNAAGYGIIGSLEMLEESEAAGMCDLNCTALTKLTHITLPYMNRKNSNIINIASSAAFVPQPYFSVYAATKSYVLSLSMALRQELRDTGIRVTAVCPGPVDTEFFDIAEAHSSIKLYKRMFFASARDVVSKALLDAYHGRAKSIFGFPMNAFELLCKLLPHGFIIKFIK